VIRGAGADLVLLQEATSPPALSKIAALAGYAHFDSRAGSSLAFMSRTAPSSYEWHRPRASRHAFLAVDPAGGGCRVFGVHLSAVHSAWTEQRRLFEFRALLASIARHQDGCHVLMGDFNTLAPGEILDTRLLPLRLRALVWLSGGRIRWRTIRRVLEAGYLDAFRTLHPHTPGPTFPTWHPHIRLDYAFLGRAFASRVARCEIVTAAPAAEASDHFPLLVELA
jgi:endonuclease/exonuclease/phosphatase family metal-dependent hydrolase